MVLRQTVAAFKWLIWNDTREVTDVRKSLFPSSGNYDGKRPDRFEYRGISKTFDVMFFIQCGSINHEVTLSEDQLTRAIYCDKHLFNRLGMPFCLSYDVTLDKGSGRKHLLSYEITAAVRWSKQ